MKKTYIQPNSSSFEFHPEQMIASSMKVSDKHVDSQLSNKKDMWGNEGMWK